MAGLERAWRLRRAPGRLVWKRRFHLSPPRSEAWYRAWEARTFAILNDRMVNGHHEITMLLEA